MPHRVLLDADVAFDDGLAILDLLRNPPVKVSGITIAGTGEAHVVPGGRNTRGLLALAGSLEVPVVLGGEELLASGHPFPDFAADGGRRHGLGSSAQSVPARGSWRRGVSH